MNCPYCGKKAVWCENKAIYGKNYGKSYMIYLCRKCQASIGCHENTKTPLGTMASAELREWRKKAHKAFDPLWKEKGMARRDAYNILKSVFGKQIHIGESDKETCIKIILVVNKLKEKKQVDDDEPKEAF